MKKAVTKADNYSYMLIGLTFLLFCSAVVDEIMPETGQHIVLASMVIALMSGVWSIRSNHFVFTSGIGFVSGVIIVIIMGLILDVTQLDVIHMLLMLCFFCMTLCYAGKQVLLSGNITINSIIGSICIFLLLGLIWSLLYLLLIEFSPESFSGISINSWINNFPEMVYFSFITLTTLGYGDVLPTNSISRFLAYMEAITGLFYMAIVVSSLVGAQLNNESNNNGNMK
ncbi:MAG: potassium channel family protein [gamma proteobacterium symbiont of Taylorina sp.]|nr:potassium channel family protein [gamma proteobacterium symbiont of Taylorina sp.]